MRTIVVMSKSQQREQEKETLNKLKNKSVRLRKDASDIRNVIDLQDGEVRIYQRTKNSGDVKHTFYSYLINEDSYSINF